MKVKSRVGEMCLYSSWRAAAAFLSIVFLGMAGPGLPAAHAQAAPRSCQAIAIDMDGNAGEVLERLVAAYESRAADALRDAAGFGQFKKALTECVLDLIFVDLSQANGTAARPLRTIDLVRFLDNFKLGWNADAVRESKLKELARSARQQKPASPKFDADLVLYLDRAVAKGPNGLLRAHLDDCAPNYEDTVNRKIARFTEIIAKGDYAGGPLQVLVHDLLAVSLEEAALMANRRGDSLAVRSLGDRAIAQLGAALRTIDDETVINRDDAKLYRNDFRFRTAVLEMLLGDANWSRTANGILADASTWNQAEPLDHVYVRDFIRWPRTNTCEGNETTGKQTNDKSGKLNAFFNPGQITLYLCAWDAPAGDLNAKAMELDQYLKRFANRDYRVYITSSRDIERLTELAEKYNGVIQEKLAAIEAMKTKLDAAAPIGRRDALDIAKRGAERCGISEERRAEIQDLDVPRAKGTWSSTQKRRLHGIYLGDFLSREEAEALAAELAQWLGLDEPPYIARPKING